MKIYSKLLFAIVIAVSLMLVYSSRDTFAQQEPFQTLNPSGYGSSSGNYTMGYQFTPSADGEITKLWCRSAGTRTVYLYTSGGSLLTSASVSCSGDWGSTDITPVEVSSGSSYRVAVYTSGSTYYSKSSAIGTTGDITINGGYYRSGTGFPTTNAGSTVYGFADITFVEEGAGGGGGGGEEQIFNSSDTWQAPAGVASVTVACWGGGGGGRDGRSSSPRGDGGGGGAYASSIVSVTPGNNYTVSIGSGGGAEQDGGDSYFINTSTVKAAGGRRAGGSPGQGGTAGNSVGSTRYSGGSGGSGSSLSGGGGGGSAFDNANGGNGSGSSGGSGEGNGGNGSSGAGGSGSAPGGGGGAGGFSGSSGGSGAGGRCILTWEVAQAPTVTNSTATSITSSGATLRSTVNPNGTSTTVYYKYGTSYNASCTSLSGSTTTYGSIGSGSSNVSPNGKAVSGLSAATTYYWCTYATNTGGTTYASSVTSFTTLANSPTLTSPTATSITASTATLGGNVTSDGGATITGRGVCYSTSDNTPGLSEGGVTCESTSGTTGTFTVNVSSLSQNTLYYYRAYATNSQGTSYTSTDSFTTLASTPTVTTDAASSITQTTATVNSTVNPNGFATIAWFRHYTSNPGSCSDSGGTRSPSSSGASMGSGSSGVSANRSLSNLTPGTTYYVCAFASNTHGTGVGSPVSFQTSAGTPTSVSASGESGLSSYYVTLNGTGTPNNFASYGFFRLYTSNPGSCSDSGGTRFPASSGSDTSLGSGASGADFSYQVTGAANGITPQTTYYYCAFARNQYGTTPSSVDSFTTSSGPVGPCDPPLSGNHTVLSSCTYSGDINGTDAGTGASNTSILKVNPGRTLTVAPGQAVTWGSMDLRGGGRVALSNGASLRRTPVWMVDADNDGYVADNTLYYGDQPEGGVRRNTLYDNYPYYSVLSGAQSGYEADCNDDAYSEGNSCVVPTATNTPTPTSAPVEETPLQTAYPSSYSGPVGYNYTMGYRFTPTVEGEITHLWCHADGTKTIKLYSDAGSILATTTANCDGGWASGSITPVSVTAGTYYRVATVLGGSGAYYRSVSMPFTQGSITIDSSRYSGGDAFPTIGSASTMYGLTDITFVAN